MARFNIEQLKTFLAIVRLGGVRKAAGALNLTQPAVTARIKNLEESLACELFERSPRGVRLTKRGELLLLHAEKFESLVEMVEKDVVDPQGAEGRLRLGVSETIAQCWLPEFVTELHRRYPEIEIEFNVDISSNLRDGLLGREIDLAILLGPVSDHTVDNVALPAFQLAWYTSAETPPAENEADFLSRPVLTYARSTRPHREVKESLFERVGPDVSVFPSTSLSACFRLVAADLGVAALPRALGREHVDAGRIREFDPGWVPSPLHFTASYLGVPKSHIVENAANLALDVAQAFESDKNTL
ncbi:MAG: LysR family transcriptional regulator [Pseudomonadota bacterium]